MRRNLIRYYSAGDLHFITCSCYRRQPWLGTARRRDLFLNVLEQVRKRYAWRSQRAPSRKSVRSGAPPVLSRQPSKIDPAGSPPARRQEQRYRQLEVAPLLTTRIAHKPNHCALRTNCIGLARTIEADCVQALIREDGPFLARNVAGVSGFFRTDQEETTGGHGIRRQSREERSRGNGPPLPTKAAIGRNRQIVFSLRGILVVSARDKPVFGVQKGH